MKDSFRITSPMTWADGYIPKSGVGKLAIAINKMLGGLSVEGATFKIDGTDFSLAVAQIIMMEADIPLFVMGASYSVDMNSSFIAMTDGSVWKFVCQVKDGKLDIEGRVATNDEISNECLQSQLMHAAIKTCALNLLSQEGMIAEGDTWIGNVVVDGHHAICMKPYGFGVLLITDKNGTDKSAWKFAIDARRNADIDEAATSMMFTPLADEEIKELKKAHFVASTQTVDGSPFPQKVGVA